MNLTSEQIAIINNNSNILVVQASPGSGKTFTIAKKIQNLIESNHCKGIIAFSFTNFSAKELKNKVNLTNYPIDKNIVISTIDSFVLETILDFRYRFAKKCIKKKDIEIKKKAKIYLANNKEIQLREWIKNLYIENKYYISETTYEICQKILENIDIARDYVKYNYSYLFIDEAQDLSEKQIKLIEILHKLCNLKIVLVGDPNQSIYKWRNGIGERFVNYFKNEKGFTKIFLSKSFRCNPSIFAFASTFINEHIKVENFEDRIKCIENTSKLNDIINSTNQKFMILTRKNDDCKYLDDVLDNAFYTHGMFLEKFENDYKFYVDEILSFFYNYNNQDRNNVIEIEEFISKLNIEELKIKKRELYPNVNISPIEYIIKIFKLLNIEDNEFIKYLNSNHLINESVINFYKKNNINKIMTIHQSKGLESENVVVQIKNLKKMLQNEDELKLFYVAFTRAIKNLYILIETREDLNFLKEIINKLKIRSKGESND